MNKQIAVVTLLVAIAAIAAAYDFNDPIFNQILASDLEELHSYQDTPLHPRSRRDEEAVAATDKCKQRKKKLCCAEESFETQHEATKLLKKECYKQITGKDKDNKDGREFDPFRCEKVDKHRKEITCVMQCVGQKMDILDKDGVPKEAEFSKFVKDSMAKESWFLPLQDKVVPKCLAEAKNATSQRDTSDTESCNTAGIKLVHCMFREVQLACPADQIKDEKACSRARDKIQKHNEFFSGGSAPFLNDE